MPHMSPMLYMNLYILSLIFIMLVLLFIWSLFIYYKMYLKSNLLFLNKLNYKWYW